MAETTAKWRIDTEEKEIHAKAFFYPMLLEMMDKQNIIQFNKKNGNPKALGKVINSFTTETFRGAMGIQGQIDDRQISFRLWCWFKYMINRPKEIRKIWDINCTCDQCPGLIVAMLRLGLTHADFLIQNFNETEYVRNNFANVTLSPGNRRIVEELIASLEPQQEEEEQQEMIENDDNDIEMADVGDGGDGFGNAQAIVNNDGQMGVDNDIAMADDEDKVGDIDGMVDAPSVDRDINIADDDEYEDVEYLDDDDEEMNYEEMQSDDLVVAANDHHHHHDGFNGSDGDDDVQIDRPVAAGRRGLPPGKHVMIYANEWLNDANPSTCINLLNDIAHGGRMQVVLGATLEDNGEAHPFMIFEFLVHFEMNRRHNYHRRCAEAINRVIQHLENGGRIVENLIIDDGSETQGALVNEVDVDSRHCGMHDIVDLLARVGPFAGNVIIFRRAARQTPLRFDIKELKDACDAGEFQFNNNDIDNRMNRFWKYSNAGQGQQHRYNIKNLLGVGSTLCRQLLYDFTLNPPAHGNNEMNEKLQLLVRFVMHLCTTVEDIPPKLTPESLGRFEASRDFFARVQFDDGTLDVHMTRLISFIDRVLEFHEETGIWFSPSIFTLMYHYGAHRQIWNEFGQGFPNWQKVYDRMEAVLACDGGSEFGNLTFDILPQPAELRDHVDMRLQVSPLPAPVNAQHYHHMLPQPHQQQQVDDLSQAVAICEFVSNDAMDVTRFDPTPTVRAFVKQKCLAN